MSIVPDRYSRTAVLLHWSAAAVILIALVSGFASDTPSGSNSDALRAHVALGVTGGVLTVLRLYAWLRASQRPAPAPHASRVEAIIARSVHLLLYIVPLGLVASGIATLVLSGAGLSIFSSDPSLPQFEEVGPRAVHGVGALLLAALVAAHVGAALWHHYVRQDGLLQRMGVSLPPLSTRR
jgi:cytochrome b561